MNELKSERMKELKTKGIFLLLLCAFSFSVQAALPSVTLKDVNGHPVQIDQLGGKGKPVIISFFATWCKPCMRELKAIDELYPDWQDEYGVEMYIVSTDQGQDSKKVKPLVDGQGWDYHVLLDPNGELKRAMNVQSIPHIFVLDGKGKTVYNHVGYTDGDELEIEKKLRELGN